MQGSTLVHRKRAAGENIQLIRNLNGPPEQSLSHVFLLAEQTVKCLLICYLLFLPSDFRPQESQWNSSCEIQANASQWFTSEYSGLLVNTKLHKIIRKTPNFIFTPASRSMIHDAEFKITFWMIHGEKPTHKTWSTLTETNTKHRDSNFLYTNLFHKNVLLFY